RRSPIKNLVLTVGGGINVKLCVHQRSLLVGVSLVAVSSAIGLNAQEAAAQPPADDVRPESRMEEIVVTAARKRPERLMDVPVSVRVLNAAKLERTGVVNLEQIALLAPQVVVARGQTGAGGSFTIRGLGTPLFDPAAAPSVQIVIDGVGASRGNIVTQGFF